MATPADSATVTWSNSAPTTDWFTAGNWIRSPSGNPVAGDSIYIGTNTSGAATSGVVIINSGNAQGSSLSLGYADNTTGMLTVQQAASLVLTGSLTLGTSGTGSMKIAGGNVSTSGLYVGYRSGSAGTGYIAGTGHLQITDGGVLNTTSTSYTIIGYQAGALQSTVLIDGQGSEWNTSGGVIIGGSGAGSGAVTVQNGGLLNLKPGNSLGLGLADAVGATGSLVIDGPGSKVIASPGLVVGIEGTATLLVRNGATLESSSQLFDYDIIGYQSTVGGIRAEGHVVVDGQGSSWINHTALMVGRGGIGTLTISNGATVTSTYDSIIGYSRITNAPFAAHGEVLITGPGSIWTTATLDMAVYNGAEAILTVSDGGTLKTTGSSGIRIGNGGYGVINIGSPVDQPATSPGHIDSDNIVLVDRNRSLLNFNHTAMATDNYTFSASLSGDGTVDVLSGVTLLTGSNTYSGPTTISGGGLKAGTANAFSSNSDFVVQSAGTLDANGISQIVASLVNAGLVQTSMGGSAGTTLIVTGSYTGQSGNLYLRTVLGDDNSMTDRLIVNGTAMGQTFVTVVNAGGNGALTTGNGILIIQTGSSSADTFRLSGRVAAGAYNYHLHFGGNATTGGNPYDQNWYLTSNYVPPSSDPEPDPRPSPEPEPVPDYRVEVPLMAAMTPIASEYGYTILGTLHERVGEVRLGALPLAYEMQTLKDKNGKQQVVRVPVSPTDQTKWVSSGWARAIGDRGFKDNGNFERRGSDYSYSFSSIQAGLDVYGRQQSNGTLDKAGFYVGYGNIDADVKGAWSGKAGSINMDAFTLGVYWTHKAPQGWYTDAVVQGTWYSTEAKSVEGQKLKPDGFGIVTSLEGGYSFALGNGLTAEPQVQLAYQNVSFDNVSDVYGQFRLSNQESLRGRLGLRIAKSWNMADETKPRLLSTWLRTNVWHEFNGDTTTTVLGLDGAYSAAVSSSLGGTWGEIGAGLSGQVTNTVALFATGSYSHSLDNRGRETWNGRLGMAVKW